MKFVGFVGFMLNVAIILTAVFISNMKQSTVDSEMIHTSKLSQYIDDMQEKFNEERKREVEDDLKKINQILNIKSVPTGEEIKPYIVMQFFKTGGDGWAEVDRYTTLEEARKVKDAIIHRLRNIGSDENVSIHIEVS
jgi:hypothetical protein